MFINRIWSLVLALFIVFIALGILYVEVRSTSGGIEGIEPQSQYNAPTEKASLNALSRSPINFCIQHANKCPLDEQTWSGEADAWNYTGKKWIWHEDTPSERNVIWIWNRPYVGPTQAYEGQREAHYSDFTSAPNDSPDFMGSAPYTYDWERWEPFKDNQRLHQYGRGTEFESWIIGETDCETGIYYPVIDHLQAFDSTQLSVIRGGECISGGYISTYRKELWGGPLSQTRIEKCDNSPFGIPASYSEAANMLCKYSPYVGVLEQRYAWLAGPPPEDQPLVGCEVTVNAWGWPKPTVVSSGQDYQAWFRNGELRFSRWIDLSTQIEAEIPAADNHAWWHKWCETAWDGTTNNLYSGIYKIGSTVYTDTIISPVSFSLEIPIEGGVLTSTLGNLSFTFPPNTFTETVTVTTMIRSQEDFIGQGGFIDIQHMYELTALSSETGMPSEPSKPYTVTIQGREEGQPGLPGDLLALKYWDGNQWVTEPTSKVLTESNTLTATPSHFSLWGVQVEVRRVYLPIIER